MLILEDVANKAMKHTIKNKWFAYNNIQVKRVGLPVGDYILANEKVLDVISRKEARGIELKKMDLLGTFKVSVDTKEDIQEIIGNVCGKSHARFRDECILAQNNNIKLIILIENKDGIKGINDLYRWENPRLNIWKPTNEVIGYFQNGKPRYKKIRKYPSATTGPTLAKALATMQAKYSVEFRFCTPMESAPTIVELLNGGE